jgi:hypothetical protein
MRVLRTTNNQLGSVAGTTNIRSSQSDMSQGCLRREGYPEIRRSDPWEETHICKGFLTEHDTCQRVLRDASASADLNVIVVAMHGILMRA